MLGRREDGTRCGVCELSVGSLLGWLVADLMLAELTRLGVLPLLLLLLLLLMLLPEIRSFCSVVTLREDKCDDAEGCRLAN